ncbi:MAG TPA: hypothetical protein VGR53_05315 [Nitrososphaerales archaeon]|nr:hypothetical protein [Nitrososphaerales archaeon]
MVKRSGIGASAASAVIFSVLLISNLTVFIAAQDRQKLYIQAGAENSLANDAHVLAAVGALGILGRAQDFLEAVTFTCANAIESTANQLASLAVIEQKDKLTVVTSASPAPSVSAFDNMSAVQPFDGSVAGYVDILLNVHASGAYLSSGVTLERTEVHLVHLPVRLEAAASECISGVEILKSSLENSRPSNCTDSEIRPILSKVIATLSATAASAGFGFGISYAVVHSWGCFVYFDLFITQRGVEGPNGSFSLGMQQADFAFLRQFVPLLA